MLPINLVFQKQVYIGNPYKGQGYHGVKNRPLILNYTILTQKEYLRWFSKAQYSRSEAEQYKFLKWVPEL